MLKTLPCRGLRVGPSKFRSLEFPESLVFRSVGSTFSGFWEGNEVAMLGYTEQWA